MSFTLSISAEAWTCYSAKGIDNLFKSEHREVHRPTKNVLSALRQISPADTVTLLSAGSIPVTERTGLEDRMAEPTQDQCGSCGTEIHASRTVDYTLKDGTRVCDSCFVRGTKTVLVQAFD
jgi:hypothetical protein